MKGNLHVRFLGGGGAVMCPCYPAPRANVGGFLAKGYTPARAWDGDAAPLTQSLARLM